ncbi:MAG TPA: gephyrin-like molybdotransferase Glp [Methylomirabilota bacterium]|nr:gephyrin-like molybdotransferase Glp [Methylomirabilota bacterium]
MTGDRLLSVEEARDAVFAAISGPTPAETAWLMEARGRVVAEPVTSPIALPPWDNSAMDGYAIRSRDVAATTDEEPARLEVIGEVRAGQAPEETVRRGTAIRIATGAPVPPGADAVIPVEETTPLDPAGVPAGPRGRDATGPLPAAVFVHSAVAPGGSIRRAGSDLEAGSRILDAGTVLTPAAMGLAAGVGLDQLSVHRRPIVGILATGDEVRSPGRDLGPAGIPDANGPGLVAMVEAAGGDPRVLGIANDRLDDVKSRICAGLVEGADALIVSGGVSVGPYDVVRAAFEAYGTVSLWRVAVQPGKPFAFGTGRGPADRVADDRPAALLFGLPGNPVSTFVTFELFVRPAIRRLGGHRDDDLFRARDRAVLADPVRTSSGRRGFVRVTVERDENGTPRRDERGRVHAGLAGGQGGQGSHVLSALATADALAVIPEADDSLPAGAEVELWWLDRA